MIFASPYLQIFTEPPIPGDEEVSLIFVPSSIRIRGKELVFAFPEGQSMPITVLILGPLCG